MGETFTIELPDEAVRKEMDEATRPYRKQNKKTPSLLSLLYDIDLLPEQIRLPVNVGRMVAVCELFSQNEKVCTARPFSAAEEMLAALTHVEAIMSIVPPRTATAEYIAALEHVRAAIAVAEAEGGAKEGKCQGT